MESAGLAEVLQMVVRRGGWLSAEPQPERGPLFTVYLPALSGGFAADSGFPPADQGAKGGAR